jgi:hypothetical protein
MCTYQTVNLAVSGSGKGPRGWFHASRASVYFDHPVHAMAEHTLNIDLINPDLGADARVALELHAGSARALAAAILEALDSVPDELLPVSARPVPER